MKKNLLFTALAATTLLLTTSCQQDEVFVDGNEAIVTFEVGTPQITTRAYSDGLSATQLKYAVYDENHERIDRIPETTTTINGSTRVEMQLAAGKTYNVLFWAANENAPYSVDFVNQTMSIDYDAETLSNNEERDAFYCYHNVQVDKANKTETVTLTRPFSQLNIGTNDLAVAIADGINVTKTGVKVSEVYSTLNLIDGTVSNPVKDQVFALNDRPEAYSAENTDGEKFPVAGYEYLAMNYLLVGRDKTVVDVEFSYGANAATAKTRKYTGIPVQANYRTNIYGALLTQEIDFDVTIDPGYSGSDAVAQVADVAAANLAFANGIKSVIIAEVKAGEGNIVLPATTDAVTITLPKTDVAVTVGYATSGEKPATINLMAPYGKVNQVAINATESTVYVSGSYGSITAYTASNTLIINDNNTTIENLIVGAGNVVIEEGKVETIDQTDDNDETTIVTLGEGVEAPVNADNQIVIKNAGELTFDELIAEVIAGEGTFDGKDENGANIVVKIKPVSGKATSNTGLIPNRLQKYSNPEVYYAQYQRFADIQDVNISNVNFVFVPTAITVQDAWNTAGATTTVDNINGELQFMNKGNVTLTNCQFDKIAISPFEATTLNISECQFDGLMAYAIKDIKATEATIAHNVFTDCNGAFWFSNAPQTVNATENTFTGVGRRGAIQFSAAGDYTNSELNVTENKVTDDGAFLWQLNTTITYNQIKPILENNTYKTAFVEGSIVPTAAAKIGETEYATLEEAIEIAKTGDVIVIIGNITTSKITIAQDKQLTIDLNGKTISTVSGNVFFNEGNLTITGKGTITSGSTYGVNNSNSGILTIDGADINAIYNIGELTFKSGSINNAHSGKHGIYSYDAKLNIIDGTFHNSNWGNATIYIGGTTEATIDGGTFSIQRGQDVGGPWTSCLIDANNTAQLTINGGTFNGGSRVQANATMTINDGSFNDCTGSNYNIYGTTTIYGGTYTDVAAIAFAKKYVAEGKLVVEKDGVANVQDAIIKIGKKGYATLQQAVDDVKDNDVITLSGDVNFTTENRTELNGYYEGIYYIGDKSFTIDLGGNTIENTVGAVNDYMLLFKNDGEKKNTITITNGTIDAGTNAYCAICTSTTNTQKITINLEDITLINNKSNGATAKIRGGAELNVNKGTIIIGQNSYTCLEIYGTNTVANIYDGSEFYQNGTSSYVGSLVGASNNATINVYGGKGISAKSGFIVMTSGGTINVHDGEWTANTNGTPSNDNNAALIAQYDNATYPGAVTSIVNVYGGTFKGGYNCYANIASKAEININGGNFNADPTAYVENDKTATESNGTWTVQ